MIVDYDFKSGFFPVVNGILFADGSIENYRICEDNQRKRVLQKCSCSNSDIAESSLIATHEYQFDDVDVKFSIGEGSYGGDGFILAESLSTKKFLWLISFDESNPFISLRRLNETLLIENNCYEVWEINIKNINKPLLSIIQQSKYFK